jgi:hypothetical protein
VNDAGLDRYTVSIWQMAGDAIVVVRGQRMRSSNRLDVELTGGAAYGDLGGLEPVTLPGGHARAAEPPGGRKLGFFGMAPQLQSAGWSLGALPDARTLNGSSDLAQVRTVLGTLLREMRRYGLLEAPHPRQDNADERT